MSCRSPLGGGDISPQSKGSQSVFRVLLLVTSFSSGHCGSAVIIWG